MLQPKLKAVKARKVCRELRDQTDTGSGSATTTLIWVDFSNFPGFHSWSDCDTNITTQLWKKADAWGVGDPPKGPCLPCSSPGSWNSYIAQNCPSASRPWASLFLSPGLGFAKRISTTGKVSCPEVKPFWTESLKSWKPLHQVHRDGNLGWALGELLPWEGNSLTVGQSISHMTPTPHPLQYSTRSTEPRKKSVSFRNQHGCNRTRDPSGGEPLL